MKDFQAFRKGRFRKSFINFDLRDTLFEIIDIANWKAKQQQTRIIFNPTFETEPNHTTSLSKLVEYNKMKKNLLSVDQNIMNHPLLQNINGIQKNQQLPISVIGDPRRLQQVMLNIILNSIKFTPDGEVAISVYFNFIESQIVLVVQDEGTGIAIEDQKTIFKLFKILPEQIDPQ